jgi:hypothetical protein
MVDQWKRDNIGEPGTEQFGSVIWNPRLGTYESREPIQESKQTLGTFTQTVIVCAVIWSLCERPFELLFTRSLLEGAACIAGKLIWLSLGLWALLGARPAQAFFAFCCAASAMAIGFGLIDERRFSTVGICLSAVECALKATAFLCLVFAPSRQTERAA